MSWTVWDKNCILMLPSQLIKSQRVTLVRIMLDFVNHTTEKDVELYE